jgi:hypothetical protein
VAAPATAQLLNHPVQALPQGPAEGNTFVAAQWARGLNENSRELNSFAVAIGRGMEKISYTGQVGYLLDAVPDVNELTLGANVAYHLLSDDSTPVQVSVQAGYGWASFDDGAGGSVSAVRPWVMPRMAINKITDFDTVYDFGVSGGVSFTTVSGASVQVAGDWVNVEGGSPFGMSLGFHYLLGR